MTDGAGAEKIILGGIESLDKYEYQSTYYMKHQSGLVWSLIGDTV